MISSYVNSFSLSKYIESVKHDPENILLQIDRSCDLIEQNNPCLQAFLPEDNRRERLKKEAKQLLEKFPDVGNWSPLFGVLIGVKDIFRVEGFTTRAGSKLPENLFVGKEAVSVAKLKQAGSLVLGKTVTTEFAYFEPGPTRNPVNIAHTPGGSSSGSAAAVAAGFCPLSLGTQTIGSIIRPAAFCGIFGFKPSFGRISTEGVIPFSGSADHIGFFTQNIDGAESVASVLFDKWETNNNKLLPVIGIPVGRYLDQASEDVRNVFDEEIKKIQKKGLVVKQINLFENITEINKTHREMCAAEMAMEHKYWFAEYENLYRPHTKQLILDGKKVTKVDLELAKNGRFLLREKLSETMHRHGIDIWVSPSTITDAPFGLESTGSPIMNLPWTFAGMPAITVPAGVSKNNMPLGLQFTARFNDDEKLLCFVRNVMQ